ncbi:MAG: peptidase S41, partial [Fulvivirga sp.]
TTQVENNLKKLEENALEENYYEDIKDRLKELTETLEASKANDLDDFKSQIKTLLEEEITGRYYLERGSIETSFDNDEDIAKSVEILNNPAKYNEILSKK